MTDYRMVVFKSGLLWRSHNISASDDETATGIAQKRFDELAREFRRQGSPGTLERFILYDGIRVVREATAGKSR
jgi:hypothetical protein